jgi:hypothetical protein
VDREASVRGTIQEGVERHGIRAVAIALQFEAEPTDASDELISREP